MSTFRPDSTVFISKCTRKRTEFHRLNFFVALSVLPYICFFFYVLVNIHPIQFHENTPNRVVTWELMDGRMDYQTDTTEIIFALAQAS